MTAPYYADEDVTLYLGDCLAVLPGLPDCSVDAIVTDPPYGLEFMGRDWDAPWQAGVGIGEHNAGFSPGAPAVPGVRGEIKALPSFTGSTNPTCRNCGGTRQGNDRRSRRRCRCDRPEFPNTTLPRMHAFQAWCEQWAAECLRVLKPGGWLLAFGGTRTSHRLVCGIEDAGFEIRDSIDWIYGSGFPKNPACLKPAHEPIVMARKSSGRSDPLPGLDGCRVQGTPEPTRFDPARHSHDGWRHDTTGAETAAPAHDAGRWPPNVVLGGEAAAELDRQSGVSASKIGKPRQSGYGMTHTGAEYDDAGGASRFFPVFRYEAKAPASERPRLPDGTAHPTVKPVDLMAWLVRLVTPTGGRVLDPFAGSGATAEACIVEGFRCILIEQDPPSAALIRKRLSKPIQPVMFGLDAS